MKKVAMYLRLSKEDNLVRDESNSISNQRRLLYKRISDMEEFKGYEVIEFKDDGYSGRSIERPGLQDMLSLVKKGGIAAILCKDISRFSRDYLMAGKYLEQIFPFMGVRFIAVNDDYDSKDFSGGIAEIDVAFKEILYDYYCVDASEKVKTAKHTAARNGKYVVSQTPYGYRKADDDRHRVVIDDEAAKTVKIIFQMFLEGMSRESIARKLNDIGTDSPGAYKKRKFGRDTKRADEKPLWSGYMVTRILSNEFYIGTYVYHMTEVVEVSKGARRNVPPDDWIRVPDHHDPLVSGEDFRTVQGVLRQSPARGKKRAPQKLHALSGKVVCGCCGKGMAHKWGGRRRGTDRFVCDKVYRGGNTLHERNVVRDVQLEQAVIYELNHQVEEYADLKKVRKESVNQQKAALDREVKKLACTEKDMELCYEDQRTAYEDYRMERISLDDYMRRKELLEQNEEDLKDRLANQQSKVSALEAQGNAALDGDALSAFLEGGRARATDTLTSDLAEKLIDKITVWPDGRMEIGWKFAEVYRRK